jgi:hypothetical protein
LPGACMVYGRAGGGGRDAGEAGSRSATAIHHIPPTHATLLPTGRPPLKGKNAQGSRLRGAGASRAQPSHQPPAILIHSIQLRQCGGTEYRSIRLQMDPYLPSTLRRAHIVILYPYCACIIYGQRMVRNTEMYGYKSCNFRSCRSWQDPKHRDPRQIGPASRQIDSK